MEADSKSAASNGVGVQVPFRAPLFYRLVVLAPYFLKFFVFFFELVISEDIYQKHLGQILREAYRQSLRQPLYPYSNGTTAKLYLNSYHHEGYTGKIEKKIDLK